MAIIFMTIKIKQLPVVPISVVRVAQVYGIDPGGAAQVEHEMSLLSVMAAPDIGVINRGAVQGGSSFLGNSTITYAVLEMIYTTGLPNKACTWFGELCSCPCLVSRNKLHQTTYKPYSGALYTEYTMRSQRHGNIKNN